MNKNDLLLLFDYNHWANTSVLRACQFIAPEQMFVPAQCSFGSLVNTLAHILGAEMLWRIRIEEGISPTRLANAEDFQSLDALATRWRAEEAAMQRFLHSLQEPDLERWVEYTTTSGKQQGSTVWKALAHVVFHGMQFRAEAGVVLAGFGHSPGDLDLLWYLRETDQR